MESDSITVSRDGQTWVVELHGEHDLSTSPGLADALRCVHGSAARVVVDLTGARFIDSSVLAALLHAGEDAGETGGRVAVVAPGASHPRRLLDLVGADRPSLRVVETRADAFRLVARAG